MKLPYAEDINYFKTSQSSPDRWLGKAAAQIEKLGGTVLTYAFGNDPSIDSQAYMMLFEIEDRQYKVIWPVLPQYYQNRELAAKRQAATLLYHDIKNKCLNALIKGSRQAFFEYLMLPDGRTPPEIDDLELSDVVPKLLLNIGKKLIE